MPEYFYSAVDADGRRHTDSVEADTAAEAVRILEDEGCRDIVESGILKRLKVLDLRHGRITDEGARTLAACPDLARLERLDLSHNELTPEGEFLLADLNLHLDTE